LTFDQRGLIILGDHWDYNKVVSVATTLSISRVVLYLENEKRTVTISDVLWSAAIT
jgi:hypothetical protein